MACRGFLACLLKLLNFLLSVVGLSMVGYGIYLLVDWKRVSTSNGQVVPLTGEKLGMITLGRPTLMMVSLTSNILDKLPKAWFIYLFIAVGAILFIISCCGWVGACTRNGCFLSCYSALIIILILVELGVAAFIFFDHSWEKEIPKDKTGDYDMIHDFLEKNWNIARWVALGAVILQALAFILALVIRAASKPLDYDSDDEFINTRAMRQPFITRQPVPATGYPASGGALDNRPSRNNAWSTRMKEKYGLDTAEFTYNPEDPSSRFQQQTGAPPAEDRSRCTIM